MKNSKPVQKPTIGILYPGDMGSSFGKLLADDGFRVVTTVAGRSQRTRQLAQEAGLTILDSLPVVVCESDVVFSFVPPSAAIEVAEQYRVLARRSPRRAIYVDANSVAPATVAQLAELFSDTWFVDGAIHGLAAQLRSMGTLYLSGQRASEIAALMKNSLRTRYLGDAPGTASTMKMLLGGMSKGMVALYVEMCLLASAAGLADELRECYRHFYPGVMTAVERMLPTYPRHALRRGDEMGELEATMRSFGLDPCMIRAVHQLIQGIAHVGLDPHPHHPPAAGEGQEGGWQVDDVIRELYEGELLRRVSSDADLAVEDPLAGAMPVIAHS